MGPSHQCPINPLTLVLPLCPQSYICGATYRKPMQVVWSFQLRKQKSEVWGWNFDTVYELSIRHIGCWYRESYWKLIKMLKRYWKNWWWRGQSEDSHWEEMFSWRIGTALTMMGWMASLSAMLAVIERYPLLSWFHCTSWLQMLLETKTSRKGL